MMLNSRIDDLGIAHLNDFATMHPPVSAETKAASPARDEAAQNIQQQSNYPANPSDTQDCPKWHKCSAPICPLDAEWSLRKHIKSERVCFYLAEAAKVPLESILRGSTAIGLAEKVTNNPKHISTLCTPEKGIRPCEKFRIEDAICWGASVSRPKKPEEAVTGTFTAVPHALLDSVAFMGASHRARSLLFELIRQHNGRNNGHLQLTAPYLAARGWRSTDQVKKAEVELTERGLIVKTRQGGLNAGPNYFAVTWLSISNFVGLDIRTAGYIQGAYSLLNPLPNFGKAKTVLVKLKVARNCIKRSVARTGAAPCYGADTPLAAPYYGAKIALFDPSSAPYYGNNELYQSPPLQPEATPKLPVVGKQGKSGKRGVGTQNGAHHNSTETIRVVELSEDRHDKR